MTTFFFRQPPHGRPLAASGAERQRLIGCRGAADTSDWWCMLFPLYVHGCLRMHYCRDSHFVAAQFVPAYLRSVFFEMPKVLFRLMFDSPHVHSPSFFSFLYLSVYQSFFQFLNFPPPYSISAIWKNRKMADASSFITAPLRAGADE